MNQWSFVIAAYVLTALVTGGLALASWWAMRAAEREPVSSSSAGCQGSRSGQA